MTLPWFILKRLKRFADRVIEAREPDFLIGGADDPYIRRWWVIPRNRWFNLYLHEILRSDDDRALHDHPWLNASILVHGCYFEHRIEAGGIHRRVLRWAGQVVFRRARTAHRLEVIPGKRMVTLFFTGPAIRHWGFHCPDAGWRHWEDFTDPEDRGLVGIGCGAIEGPLPVRRRKIFDLINPRAG